MTEKNIIVHKHMSDTELRAIINERMHLSPKRATSLLKDLEFKLREMPSDKTFEEYYGIAHTEEAVFYCIGYGRPDPYFDYVFLTRNFIIYIYIGSNYIKFDFNENTNIPTEQEKKELSNYLLDMLEIFELIWIDIYDRDSITIEFVGG